MPFVANITIGIRDPMGTGLGARPIMNTDVFCFAPPDTDGGWDSVRASP